MSDELNVINRKSAPEPCRYLISKGMLINAGMPEGEELVGDGHVWCRKSQESLGPDRRGVDRETCVPGRACYETIL